MSFGFDSMGGYYGAIGVENEQQARDLVNNILQDNTSGMTDAQRDLLGTGIYREVGGLLGMQDLAGNPITRTGPVTYARGVAVREGFENASAGTGAGAGAGAGTAAGAGAGTAAGAGAGAGTGTGTGTGTTATSANYDWSGSYESNFPEPSKDNQYAHSMWLSNKSIWDSMPADQRETNYFPTIVNSLYATGVFDGNFGSGVGVGTGVHDATTVYARSPIQNLTSGGNTEGTTSPGFTMPTMDDVLVRSDKGPTFGPEYKVASLPANPFSATATPGERYLMSLGDYVTTHGANTGQNQQMAQSSPVFANQAQQAAQAQQTAEMGLARYTEAGRLAAEQLAAEQASADETAADETAADETVDYQTVAQQINAEQTAGLQAAADRLAAEQLATDQTAAEQLAAETVSTTTGGNNVDFSQNLFTLGATSPNKWAKTAGPGSYLKDPWLKNGRYIVIDPSGRLHQTFDEAEAMQLSGRNFSNAQVLETLNNQSANLLPYAVAANSDIARDVNAIRQLNTQGYRVVLEGQG